MVSETGSRNTLPIAESREISDEIVANPSGVHLRNLNAETSAQAHGAGLEENPDHQNKESFVDRFAYIWSDISVSPCAAMVVSLPTVKP